MEQTKKAWTLKTQKEQTSKEYKIVFAIEDVSADKLFQYETVYKEYVKLLRNQYVMLLDKWEFEKALGIKQALEFIISEGEEYLIENKTTTS